MIKKLAKKIVLIICATLLGYLLHWLYAPLIEKHVSVLALILVFSSLIITALSKLFSYVMKSFKVEENKNSTVKIVHLLEFFVVTLYVAFATTLGNIFWAAGPLFGILFLSALSTGIMNKSRKVEET